MDLGWRLGRRQVYVASYVLPEGLGQELRRRYPSLQSLGPANRGLRQWLRIQVVARDMLGMPSLAVDLLWHEFILHTEAYDQFCRRAYGRKLHHYPEVAMSAAATETLNGPAMALAFALACLDEGMCPAHPDRLPILFGADSALDLPDGRHWDLDCRGDRCRVRGNKRCVWHDLVPLVPRLPKLLRLNGANRLVPQTRWIGGTYVGTGGCGGGGAAGSGGHGCGGGQGCGGHGCGGGCGGH